jgi:hypothetical protein
MSTKIMTVLASATLALALLIPTDAQALNLSRGKFPTGKYSITKVQNGKIIRSDKVLVRDSIFQNLSIKRNVGTAVKSGILGESVYYTPGIKAPVKATSDDKAQAAGRSAAVKLHNLGNSLGAPFRFIKALVGTK